MWLGLKELLSFHSQEKSICNFSQLKQTILKQTGDENKAKYQQGDTVRFNTKFSKIIWQETFKSH